MNVITKIYNAFAGVTIKANGYEFDAVAFTLIQDEHDVRDILGTLVQSSTGRGAEDLSQQPFVLEIIGKNSDEEQLRLQLHGVTLTPPPIYTMGIQDPCTRHKIAFVAQRYIPWTRVAA